MDHYPFTDDFTLGCDGPELGSRLDREDMAPMPAADRTSPTDPSGFVDTAEDRGEATLIRGWVVGPDDPVRCVVYIDGTGTVTGGGQDHLPRRDVAAELNWVPADVGFSVIAPRDPEGRLVVVLDSGRLLWLAPRTEADEAAG